MVLYTGSLYRVLYIFNSYLSVSQIKIIFKRQWVFSLSAHAPQQSSCLHLPAPAPDSSFPPMQTVGGSSDGSYWCWKPELSSWPRSSYSHCRHLESKLASEHSLFLPLHKYIWKIIRKFGNNMERKKQNTKNQTRYMVLKKNKSVTDLISKLI